MSLKLTRRHGSPHWYIRGTIRGVTVDESTGVADRKSAETIRAQREWEIIQASIHGRKATASFLEAAVAYMEAGGERRYLKRLIDHFGNLPLAKIDQAAIEQAARILCPSAAPSTVNRQIHTPVSAVVKHAAARGLCEHKQIERPRQPRGRVRWLTPSEADRLIAAFRASSPTRDLFAVHRGSTFRGTLYRLATNRPCARAGSISRH